MKIDIKEGIYRIFIILSVCVGLFVLAPFFLQSYYEHELRYILLGILAGLFAACLVYLSYFVVYWIIDGFCKISNNFDDKNVIFLFLKNYKDFKFSLFLFCIGVTMGVTLFLGMMLLLQSKKTDDTKSDLNECRNSNYQCEEMLKVYENTSRELSICKDKLRGVLNYKTEKELLEDEDAWAAKDYNPDESLSDFYTKQKQGF